MPIKEIITQEYYQLNENGETVLVDTVSVEVEVQTEQELIAEKEAELLKMYAELQALKTN
jgi:ligand-binding SRPBCC domain-containing protein